MVCGLTGYSTLYKVWNMDAMLSPTLWRSARVLANAGRLQVLHVVNRAGSLSVSAVAEGCGLSLSHATQMLRALQARGLIQASRKGSWVFYAPEVNSAIAYARPLADALRPALEKTRGDYRPIVSQLTAYTHPRRIAIVKAVARGYAKSGEVRARCGLSRPALSRHLSKLKRRGVLEDREGLLSILPQSSPLASALLVLALAEPD